MSAKSYLSKKPFLIISQEILSSSLVISFIFRSFFAICSPIASSFFDRFSNSGDWTMLVSDDGHEGGYAVGMCETVEDCRRMLSL